MRVVFVLFIVSAASHATFVIDHNLLPSQHAASPPGHPLVVDPERWFQLSVKSPQWAPIPYPTFSFKISHGVPVPPTIPVGVPSTLYGSGAPHVTYSYGAPAQQVPEVSYGAAPLAASQNAYGTPPEELPPIPCGKPTSSASSPFRCGGPSPPASEETAPEAPTPPPSHTNEFPELNPQV